MTMMLHRLHCALVFSDDCQLCLYTWLALLSNNFHFFRSTRGALERSTRPLPLRYPDGARWARRSIHPFRPEPCPGTVFYGVWQRHSCCMHAICATLTQTLVSASTPHPVYFGDSAGDVPRSFYDSPAFRQERFVYTGSSAWFFSGHVPSNLESMLRGVGMALEGSALDFQVYPLTLGPTPLPASRYLPPSASLLWTASRRFLRPGARV